MILPLEHHTRGFAFNAHRLDGLSAPHKGHFDPILSLDHFMLREAVFPPHPHAGFSALTVLFEESASALQHRDSLGNHHVIPPGGAYWLEAGSGVMHEEVPLPSGQAAHGVQIFINHAADTRDCPPRGFEMDVPPVVSGEGFRLRLCFGKALGVMTWATPHTPLTVIDGFGDCTLPFPDHWRVLVLPIASTVTVNGLEAFDRHAIVQHGTVQVSGAHWLLLAGAPFQQPFENHGPFVMNDRAGLVKAGKDFLAGRMGRLEKLGSLA